jgi:hypothetical protein
VLDKSEFSTKLLMDRKINCISTQYLNWRGSTPPTSENEHHIVRLGTDCRLRPTRKVDFSWVSGELGYAPLKL